MCSTTKCAHLSPLLFILFINDLNKYFKTCKFLLLVDNMKILILIHSINDMTSLQHDLDQFSTWCFLNGMSLNTSKCVCLLFHINM